MVVKHFDVAVIGAGISGLAFARFYLDTHPDNSLAIFEEDTCVGGVWSSSRLYNGFWSQGGLRMSGFSDIPITLPPNAQTYHDIFEAKYVTKYLEEYVDRHVYSSRTLRDRIIFGLTVQALEKIEGAWKIFARRKGMDATEIYACDRLVVATGHTSFPNMPTLPQQSDFRGLIIHQKEFGKATEQVFASDSYKTVAILGGGKSAADMVYDSVKAGKKVSWIIRKSGEGPAAFSGAAGKGPYRNGPEIAATRMMSALSPSCFAPVAWWTRMIHGTNYGRKTVSKIWLGADQACRDLAKLQDREGALPGFENMASSTNIFWCTGPLGMIQREDFWETIAKNVSVYRSDISSMQKSSILLEDGSQVSADVLFCGTGWSKHYPFLSAEQVIVLGLPHPPNEDKPEEAEKWSGLLQAADKQVLELFPQLAHPPPYFQRPTETTALRLYNCIAPIRDDSVVFLGHIQLSNSFRTAEAQAIWATAYFDGVAKLPEKEQTEKEIAYMNAFSRRRYPSHGSTGDYFHMDLVSYTDKLMNDVGLSSHRKRWWWQDLMAPCLANDFRNAKDEYLLKYKY